MRRLVYRKSERRGTAEQRGPRPKLHITKGDRVRVMTGEDAGTEGTVLRVIPKAGRVVVEGVNMVTKHRRPGPNDEGGIIHFPAPVDVSNVMLLDPKTSEPTRVRRKKDQDGTVERLSVKSGQPIPRNR